MTANQLVLTKDTGDSELCSDRCTRAQDSEQGAHRLLRQRPRRKGTRDT